MKLISILLLAYSSYSSASLYDYGEIEGSTKMEIVADTLNCREGAGREYSVVKSLKKGQIYYTNGDMVSRLSGDSSDESWIYLVGIECYAFADSKYIKKSGLTVDAVACETDTKIVKVKSNEEWSKFLFSIEDKENGNIISSSNVKMLGRNIDRYRANIGNYMYEAMQEFDGRGGNAFLIIEDSKGRTISKEACRRYDGCNDYGCAGLDSDNANDRPPVSWLDQVLGK